MSADNLITDLAKQANKPPPAVGLGIASATILDFNTTTFENRLDYYGTDLVDVPVLSGTDALSYRAGDEVILQTWHPVDGHRRRGLGSYYILGRVVRPGAANAQRTIQFLQNQLAKQIAREVIAEVIMSAEAPDEVITTDTAGAFVDLTGGPVIPSVEIGPSGRALVIVSAGLLAAPTGLDGTVTCWMSYEVAGATSVAASTSTSLELLFRRGDGDVTFHPASRISASRVSLADNLNEGLHTFTAKYRVDEFGPDEGSFFARNLTVIPF